MATDAITTDQAHREGYDAFRAGQSGSRKPYPSTTPQGRAWVDGWLAAQGERAEAERNGTWNTPASEASATAAGNPGTPTGVTSPDCPAGNGHPAGPSSQHKEAAMAGAEQPEPAAAGHNSGGQKMADTQGITGDQLKSYIERIEKLEEEIANINADKREVYSEAKANGFDTKVMRQLIQLRRKDPQDRSEQEELLHVYKRAIGME
jgi:uncharacterized protein (UPF0335 family)/ribosome modulation factor